jgi:predicted dithiol-disulfide oxidoreductase (DUF899 family)
MPTTFPGESTQYRTARDRLLEQEIELRRAMEAVAAARRALPPGGAVSEAVVARAPLPRLLAFGEERGWRRLRLLSAAATSFNRDFHAETADAAQRPMLNVFHRDAATIRHPWGSELLYAPTERGQEPRHVGTIEPLWNLLDLIPEGRGVDWDEQFAYEHGLGGT